jgi:hypothetical protein
MLNPESQVRDNRHCWIAIIDCVPHCFHFDSDAEIGITARY